jgi:hypothetical protein
MRRFSKRIKAVWLKSLLSGLGLILICFAQVSAHEGPPYPVIVDRVVGHYVVSIWADPDVGTGTFFVILEPRKGGELPGDINVGLAVQPVSGRLAEAHYGAVRDSLRGQVQYKAEVLFDREELWRVRVLLSSSQGSEELSTDIEATPPGYGRWDLLVYLFPFLVIGLLWLRAVFRGRSRKPQAAGLDDKASSKPV